MKTITIDRSRWLHGEGGHASKLQRAKDGKRCCIGFVCLAYGAAEADITDKGNPRYLPNPITKFGEWDFAVLEAPDTDALYAAFSINDARIGDIPATEGSPWGKMSQAVRDLCAKYGDGPIRDDADREARLVKLFADHGLNLVFEGEYVPTPAPMAV